MNKKQVFAKAFLEAMAADISAKVRYFDLYAYHELSNSKVPDDADLYVYFELGDVDATTGATFIAQGGEIGAFFTVGVLIVETDLDNIHFDEDDVIRALDNTLETSLFGVKLVPSHCVIDDIAMEVYFNTIPLTDFNEGGYFPKDDYQALCEEFVQSDVADFWGMSADWRRRFDVAIARAKHTPRMLLNEFLSKNIDIVQTIKGGLVK